MVHVVVATFLFLSIANGIETKYVGYDELMHEINDLKSEFNDAKKMMQNEIEDIRKLYAEEKKKNLELTERIMTLERKFQPVDGIENVAEYADSSVPHVGSDEEFNDQVKTTYSKTKWNASNATSENQPKTTKSPTAVEKSDIRQERKRVNADQKVAFFVADINPGHGAWTHQETIVFNFVLVDIGGDYNSQTGVFVCSVPGAYVFHFSIISKQSTSYEVSLVRNGNQSKSHVFMQPETSTFYGATNSAIIQLDAGDHVWLRINGDVPSDLQFGRGENTFGGFLLYPN